VEREFVAQNGRKIRISSMGNLVNLVSFQSAGGAEHINVKRSREGYVLAYRLSAAQPLRVVHDVNDSSSQIISPGNRDFVPESFTFPSVNSGIPSDTFITATANLCQRFCEERRRDSFLQKALPPRRRLSHTLQVR
jgi:hypothetical protein